MRTFASLMDFSQSALFFLPLITVFNFASIHICLSLSLWEEHWLRVFENTVLRRIFGSKRDGVTGEWRRLHNEELNDLY
jgi:hypothetical protein